MKLKVTLSDLRDESEGKVSKLGRAYFYVEDRKSNINVNLKPLFGIDDVEPTKQDYKAVLEEAVKAAGLTITPKATWSSKAGCICGCSPGFVFRNEELRGKELFVDVKIIEA